MEFNINLPELEVLCDFKSAKVCSHCGSTNTIRHTGETSRIIRDTKVRFVERQRRYCKDCQRTYTIHPPGIDKGYQRSKRLIFSCLLIYLAGLSYDKTSGLLSVLFQVKVGSKSTLWQDLQELGQGLKMKKIFTRLRKSNQPQIIAQDASFIKIKGKEFCLEFIINNSSGVEEEDSLLKVSIISSENAREIYQLIQSLKEELDLSQLKVIVSDDGSANHKAVELLNGLDFPEKGEKIKVQRVPRLNNNQILHQVCLAHTKKNALERLKTFENKAPPDIMVKLQEIIDSNFYPNYLGDIEKMVKDKRVQKLKGLHQFLFGELWEKYNKYSLFYQGTGVPNTNNLTERTIGRTKIRYKLCRGLKSISGALNFITTTQAFEAKKFDLLVGALR